MFLSPKSMSYQSWKRGFGKYTWLPCSINCIDLGKRLCIWDPGPTCINNMSKPCFNIDPFNKYGIRNFHPMTSNSFQFVFWIIFVYSLNKPVTNEIQKENIAQSSKAIPFNQSLWGSTWVLARWDTRSLVWVHS